VTSTTNGDIPCTDNAGIQEDADRRVSQNSLGEMTKLGSKTALNRRVRCHCFEPCVCIAVVQIKLS